MGDRSLDIVVVGAGVIGLSTAIVLARENKYRVKIVARDQPEHTTSCNAGAIWGPHLVNHGDVARWALATLQELTSLASERGTGVQLTAGLEAGREMVEPPSWMTKLDGFRPSPHADLPAGFTVGWRYTVPTVDMPRYLRYLTGQLSALGVEIEQRSVGDLAELSGLAPIVVNCTGIGAKTLLDDPELTPVRGDLVKVANPGITEFFAEHTDETDDQTYILPFGDFLLLGGTAAVGTVNRDPDRDIAARIVERCALVEPRLRGAEVLEHRVGIRPSRTEVRLERVNADRTCVIHNYGHGGSGVSLSWGCADEVVELVQKVLIDH